MELPAITTKVESTGARLSSRETSSGYGVDPEAHQEQCRRLAGLALTYVVGYALFYGYSWVMALMMGLKAFPPTIENTLFVCAVVIGVGTYILGRDAKIPARHFSNYAVAFQIVTSFVIAGSVWGWERHMERDLGEVWAALGGSAGEVQTKFIDPLVAKGIRLIQQGGVSGVGIWAMIFPFVVPLSTRRTLLGSGLSILSLPIMLYASVAAHGMPETLRAWAPGIVADITIPSAIAAAIGVYGSRTHYRLTRELARVKRLGSYQLVEKIGAGGMGEVWRAKHRLLVRPAAIKLIRPDALGDAETSRTALARFEREAQATSALSSPHSIELYDFGVTEDGTFYYVMELLEGLNLRALVERFGPLPAERVVFLMKQACHSLADAHARGIIHRDVKPANLFACRRGLDLDFVKVLDFGLVKHQGSKDRTQLTMEGVASGTPAFMAPEMATGERPIDARADLYALGCVGYWLLTGKLVFEGDNAVQMLLRHVREVPEPPSKRTELPVPRELDALILALLEKDPEKRPANARELSARLGECADVMPPWTEERAQGWWSAHAPAPLPAT